MKPKLDKPVEDRLAASIRRWCAQELDQEVGDLKARSLLRLFMEEAAPAVYNRAIADARDFLLERAGDLENTCFAEEGDFWKARRPGGR